MNGSVPVRSDRNASVRIGRKWTAFRLSTIVELYLLSLPAFLYVVVFLYGPMYGVIIAFVHFVPTRGILGSQWVGLEHFHRFFRSFYFWNLIRNTLGIGIYSLAVGFPGPIIFALMLNELRHQKVRKALQLVTYAPHFISTVVMVGLVIIFVSPRYGVINEALGFVGLRAIPFLSRPKWFKTIYVLSGLWQDLGWDAIIYVAALAAIDVVHPRASS